MDKKELAAALQRDMKDAEESLRAHAQELANHLYDTWGFPVTDIEIDVRRPTMVVGLPPGRPVVTATSIQINI